MSQRRMGYKGPMTDLRLTKGSDRGQNPGLVFRQRTNRQQPGCQFRPSISGWFRRVGPIISIFACAPPAATAADPEAVLRILQRQDAAVLRVGERLATSNWNLCKNGGHSAGMAVQQLSQYGGPYRAAAQRVLAVADRPTVTSLVSGGSAEQAGLKLGDEIAAVDGHVFAGLAPKRAAAAFAGTKAAQDALDAAFADGAATLAVIREGRPFSITLKPRAACQARFDVRAGRSNNASSDGLYVQVSSDLVGQAKGDGELAAIMAHELAHNILEHPQRLTAKGQRPNVRTTEIEADRLSAYLLYAARYNIADAVTFWARWGKANDQGIFSDRTHPGWKKRIATIEREAALIASARDAGKVVSPPADLLAR